MQIIDLYGLPGSGKSTISHLAADILREEGYTVKEPSWKLDMASSGMSRRIQKVFLSLQYAIMNPAQNLALTKILKTVKNSETSFFKMWINFAYTLCSIKRVKDADYVILDEGIAQAILSLYLYSPKQEFKENVRTLLSFADGNLRFIYCFVLPQTANERIQKRKNGASRLEHLPETEREQLLVQLAQRCEILTASCKGMRFDNNADTDEAVSLLVKMIKMQTE